MREIKFRAWLPIEYVGMDNKKAREIVMVYGNELKFSRTEEYGDPIIEQEIKIGENKKVYANFYFDDEKAILMQFTGLLDKRGKEVYEGDIFESPSGILFYVLWHKDGWYYNNVSDSPNHISGRLSEIANDWKVVGNIYENPELMK